MEITNNTLYCIDINNQIEILGIADYYLKSELIKHSLLELDLNHYNYNCYIGYLGKLYHVNRLYIDDKGLKAIIDHKTLNVDSVTTLQSSEIIPLYKQESEPSNE